MRRLYAGLSLAWGASWIAGIIFLVAIAIQLSAQLRDNELDADLSLYATAVYGLAWFDEGGEFHDEVLLAEPDVVDGPFDIWVIEPGEPAVVHFQPASPNISLDSLGNIARDVVRTAEPFFLDGVDNRGNAYRLRAEPTFMDGRNELAYAAVIVVGDPSPGHRVHRTFIRNLGLAALGLGVLGIAIGLLLARWSVRPVVDSIQHREDFITATAHDLRTPVAALQSVCDSAAAGDESADVALGRIAPLVSRTAQVIDDLLLSARLDAGSAGLERQKVRLDLLVEECLPESTEIQFDAEPCVIEADPRLARAAIGNLLDNARTHGGPAEANIRIRVARGVVTIDDEGPGVPPDVLALLEGRPRILPSTDGTGLGLAIARRIAVLHGGALELTNRSPAGVRAILRLDSDSTNATSSWWAACTAPPRRP